MNKVYDKIFKYTLQMIVIIFCVFPFYYSVMTSLEGSSAVFEPNFFPTEINPKNYNYLLFEHNFPQTILNSLFVATVTVSISITISYFAAWSLSRVNFKGRSMFLFVILAISMFPQIAVLTGMYQLFLNFKDFYFNIFDLRVKGVTSLLWLCFTYTMFNIPFTVWVLTTFMKGVPKELEEAAIVDGASSFLILRKIFLPIMTPAIFTTAIMAMIAVWNEFLFALTFTATNSDRTITVGIALINGTVEYEVPWGSIMAASVIVTVPLVIITLLLQGRIMSGLTAGSIKG